MFKKATFAAIALAIATTTLASGSAYAGKYNDKFLDVQRMLDDEETGGPVLEGGVAPGQTRHRVCQNLETPAYDRYGNEIVVMKKTCWFQ
ncbi:MAG: hypothetical protein C0606_09865 [Hyphomicrobiales bacterium]|nr:MAG: hypothetical protein C0606_09865 [Hyphomicrobiales bacterium]